MPILIAVPETGAPRTYRVARILSLQTLPGTFERPETFDLATFWRAYSVEFRERMYTAQAVVKVDPGAENLLGYTLGSDVVTAALAAAGEPGDDGRRTLTLPVESLSHARWMLLRMGASVEIIGPRELRELMAETIAELGKMYG